MTETSPSFSIIIPAFNEGRTLGAVLDRLIACFPLGRTEILVVNDGSQDDTAAVAGARPGVRVLSHRRNRGYGAAVKTGFRAARAPVVGLIDADGQHEPADLEALLALMADCDMAIGVREGVLHSRLWRMPGKWLIRALAQWLTRNPVPDINSGMRCIRRDVALRFLPLCPDGFSITTTLTLSMMCESLQIEYVPIRVSTRRGASTVSWRDGFRALFNVTALVILFHPRRFFLPVSGVLSLVGGFMAILGYLTYHRIPATSTIMLVSAVVVFSVGFLAEQIALLRRVLVDFGGHLSPLAREADTSESPDPRAGSRYGG